MQKWEDNPDASRRWDGWVVMDVCIDTFFMCDVIFNFFTGFYESTDEVSFQPYSNLWNPPAPL